MEEEDWSVVGLRILGFRFDKLVDLSRDKASQRAFLAVWMSVWSLLSHWPLEIDFEEDEISSLF